MAESRSTVIPGHRYRNAQAAIDWLCRVFGFERHAVYEGETLGGRAANSHGTTSSIASGPGDFCPAVARPVCFLL